jgi:hypothetical protein
MKGVIRLEEDGKTVLIKDVRVQDETLYQFLKEVDEDRRIDRLVSAIRIGVVGLKRIAVGEELDYVEKGFNLMVTKFDKMFDPEVRTSHLGKLSSLLGEYFDKDGTVENLFDPTVDDSPLGKLRKGLQDEFKELRDIIKGKEAKEEVIEITTLKGYAFEDACEKILSMFVSKHMGDEFERKTNETGEITRSFAGDFLITLRDIPDKRIVIETKDWDAITQPQIIENLGIAMRNRGAKYGIFVSKYKEALPKKIGWFNEFRGNMLVCALGSKEADTFFPEVLNIAYQWAKLRITKEITIEEKSLETITEGIKEIGTRLDTFSQIKTQCTNVDKATKEIRELSDELKDSITKQINRIRKAIATVSEEIGE